MLNPQPFHSTTVSEVISMSIADRILERIVEILREKIPQRTLIVLFRCFPLLEQFSFDWIEKKIRLALLYACFINSGTSRELYITG